MVTNRRKKTVAELNEWCVIVSGDAYTPPECTTQHLHGIVKNHTTLEDGKRITTTSIKGKREGCVVTKSGTLYRLMTPQPEYAAKYPEAQKRLMDSLPEMK